jgi:baseplate J-like protein
MTARGRVIYLDVDDEITSAAARIRAAEGTRVAVVLPHGSRVATSRINFRLLARDATTNGKRLSIVASDGATRALAASAGLPIFATVGEYESSVEGGGSDVGDDPGSAAATGVLDGERDDEPMLVSETVATPSSRPRGRRDGMAETDVGDETDSAATGAAAAVGTGAATGAIAASAGQAGPAANVAPVVASTEARRAARAPAAIPAARVVADSPDAPGMDRDRDRPRPSRAEPAGWRGVRLPIGRTPLAIGLGVLALALVVGGAVGFLFLPTATAVVTPREASLGPTSLRIVASTTATQPDPERLIVPARSIEIPLEASGTFPATGKRIEEAKATGAVRFENLDFTSTNSIPKGSVVATDSGTQFRTDKAVTVKKADLVGLTVVPSHATVSVTAVDAGPEGNVPPNSIKNVPRGEEPFFLKVSNLEATTGGQRTEFKRVKQEDVDAATAALTQELEAKFADRLDDPDLPGDAATVFPETKTLGAPVFDVEPATLVGQEVETFELKATNTGTVVAVDETPVQAVAEARIQSSVTPGYQLIDGSGQVDPAPAEITNGVITFPVVVTARQLLVLDTDAIEREIMGKPLAQAREILATYGEAQLDVWPEWVGTVPTLESRVEVLAQQPEEAP